MTSRHFGSGITCNSGTPARSRAVEYRQEVVRQVCDSEGEVLGVVHARYDGSIEDAIAVAKVLTRRMHLEFFDVSEIQSKIGVTDEYGSGKWVISPNFLHVAETGTPTAAYMFGDLRFTSAFGT